MVRGTATSTGATPQAKTSSTGLITPLRWRLVLTVPTAWIATAALRSSTLAACRPHIYHGVPGGICLATSTDDMLVNWEKHPANPVIPDQGPGAEFVVTGAPCGWVEDGVYYAVTGSSHQSPDAAYLFSSTDMAHWQYRHPFYAGGEFTHPGEDCAVPDFFMLDGKAVLSFASHARGAQFYVGSYADQRFTPERHKRLAFAESRRTGSYCEGLTLLDDRGRRILFGRFSEARFKYALIASGLGGAYAPCRWCCHSPKTQNCCSTRRRSSRSCVQIICP